MIIPREAQIFLIFLIAGLLIIGGRAQAQTPTQRLSLNQEKHLKEWEVKAEAGDAEAQYKTGILLSYKKINPYRAHIGCEGCSNGDEDEKPAYQLGADISNTEIDEAQAIQWLTKSANQNFSSAQAKLTAIYKYGIEGLVSQDYQKSYFWILICSEQKSTRAFCLQEKALVAPHLTAKEISEVEDRVAKWKPVTGDESK